MNRQARPVQQRGQQRQLARQKNVENFVRATKINTWWHPANACVTSRRRAAEKATRADFNVAVSISAEAPSILPGDGVKEATLNRDPSCEHA
jgi:hypothetical protein